MFETQAIDIRAKALSVQCLHSEPGLHDEELGRRGRLAAKVKGFSQRGIRRHRGLRAGKNQ
jgi:hypothetical protein